MNSVRRLFHPRVLAAVLFVVPLAACGDQPTEEVVPAAAEEAEPVAERAHPYDPAALEAAGRSEDDRFRDDGMKPLEVYAFFGVKPGMVIGDLATSGMYNAHILSQIVGPQGKVYAIIGLGAGAPSERSMSRTNNAFAERNVDGVLSNVELVDTLEDLPDNSVDMLITVRNYHDFGERGDRVLNVPRMLRVLKPGGILGAIDAHSANPDERDESVHRLNEALAIEEIEEGGFEFVGKSELLYNPDDTLDFDGRDPQDPIHRYYIQRWVLKFQKPMN